MKIRNQAEFAEQNVFGNGNPNNAFAQYFIGRSFQSPH